MDYGTAPNYHIEDPREPRDHPEWVTMEEFADQEGDDELIYHLAVIVSDELFHVPVYYARLTLDVAIRRSSDGVVAALDALGWREAVEQAINDRPAPSASDEP